MSDLREFTEAMERVGRKVVTRTDVRKGAYVPNRIQREVMQAAGFHPVGHEQNRLINIYAVNDDRVLPTTFYSSERLGSGRAPEVRMGRGLTNWLCEGDGLCLGTDGESIFALKYMLNIDISSAVPSDSDIDFITTTPAIERTYRHLSKRQLIRRAQAAGGPARRAINQSLVFERDPAVREAARRRSDGICENPNCGWVGFNKDNGERFIEVHHIAALGDGGDDILGNVIAICPNCHRQAHYGVNRVAMKDMFLAAVAEANRTFLDD